MWQPAVGHETFLLTLLVTSSCFLFLPAGEANSGKMIVHRLWTWKQNVDLLQFSAQMRCNRCVTRRTMNGRNSIHYMPSSSFLLEDFVVFPQKIAEGHFRMFQTVTSVLERFETGFLTGDRGDVQYARVCKGKKRAGSLRRPDAAGTRPFRWFLA